ncbi:hypothetical protein M513_14040 [Trichuris suis]|uniref:Uncharacterized protein n=1 Tax=Trichuris suis TaxID=68888 RepID=A0A085LJD7_9BILA|nr:hypothetical protein M513_14040 [Trichuris suis]
MQSGALCSFSDKVGHAVAGTFTAELIDRSSWNKLAVELMPSVREWELRSALSKPLQAHDQPTVARIVPNRPNLACIGTEARRRELLRCGVQFEVLPSAADLVVVVIAVAAAGNSAAAVALAPTRFACGNLHTSATIASAGWSSNERRLGRPSNGQPFY